MISHGGGGGRQPLSLGQKPIIWQDFCRKLHENERNWTARRAFIPSAPFDPVMNLILFDFNLFDFPIVVYMNLRL